MLLGKYPEVGRKVLLDRCLGRYKTAEVMTPDGLDGQLDGTYYILRDFPMGRRNIERLSSKTRLLHRWGVGFDAVDIEAAGEKGITVSICTGVNAQPVAELAVLLMLASYRHLPELLARSKEGRKDKEDIIGRSWMLNGKRVGLLGLGHIGQKVAAIVRGFGAEVVYYDASRGSPDMEATLGAQFLPLDEVLRTSDIISLHMPLLDSTKPLINAEAIAKMRLSALLVNTARGGIIDTDALLEALKEHRILGAALDTIEGEPLPLDHPAFELDNLLITPHAGGNTEDNNNNMASYIMDNIDAMESGKSLNPYSIVNAKFLKR